MHVDDGRRSGSGGGGPEQGPDYAYAVEWLETRAGQHRELFYSRDGEGERNKLREAAQALVDLPDKARVVLQGIDNDPSRALLKAVDYAAEEAADALAGKRSLQILLVSKGHRVSEPTYLESVVAELRTGFTELGLLAPKE